MKPLFGLRRALGGYRVAHVHALLEEMEAGVTAAQAARGEAVEQGKVRLAELSQQAAQAETMWSQLQRDYYAELGVWAALGERGVATVEVARQRMDAEVAETLTESTRREALLGQKRGALARVPQDIARVIQALLQALGPENGQHEVNER